MNLILQNIYLVELKESERKISKVQGRAQYDSEQ